VAMKTWTSSADEAAYMVYVIGERIGFAVTGRTYIYDTEPTQPPGETPSGCDIQFTPIDSERAEEDAAQA